MQLDEILRTFDPVTRAQFSTWLDQAGKAALGNAEGLNDALGLLTPFVEETDDVLEVLRAQSGATRRFIRDTGVVFDSLTARSGQLRELIRNSNRVWEAVASRDQQLADTFRVLPTFLREGRETTRRLTRFAEVSDPLITQLRPAARAAVAHADRSRRARPRPQGRVSRPRAARARLPQGPPGHRGGAQQHAPAARAARPVPAQSHSHPRLRRPLQARAGRLLRERHGCDPGHRSRLRRRLSGSSTTCAPPRRPTPR